MSARTPIFRRDYTAPDFLIDAVDLDFDLREESARVASRLTLRRNPARPADRPLVLQGQDLRLVSLALDGRTLGAGDYVLTGESLTLAGLPDRCTLDVVTEIEPQNNTALEGLYKSSGNFCTQCEAEGFRKITYFLDRPDVMAVYSVRIEAEKARYPVLLSNGNLMESGDLADGRHFARWHDPFPKPSYLFALVAGRLERVSDVFTTKSGRKVDLHIYVEPGNADKCGHAMESLKRSMTWDEDVYGLEYDLDVFMIVAVADFNMGAMENKGLNIFNTKYVLARPDTATDTDYGLIEAIIGHEYFHNWTGNRVTCRDWFQLSLKEGLTVFRDQEFSADMGSRGVRRVESVRKLRSAQFPEDAGPMAHPVRPDSYIEINNFYTATVYEKGAEVVRMYHSLLGAEGFRRGIDLYFARHDGQAVTCDDFRAAMADANGADLEQFGLWYSQSGTPQVTARGRHDPATGTYELTLEQTCPPTPGQPVKEPFHIPFAVGLIGPDGRDIPLRLDGETAAGGTTRVLELRATRQTFRFADVPRAPVPSLLRGFSAPVTVKADLSDADLAFLLAHDRDEFARWEAGQTLATRLMLRLIAERQAGRPLTLDPGFADAFAAILDDTALDREYKALVLALPSEGVLAQEMSTVDVDAIHEVRRFVVRGLATSLRERLEGQYRANTTNEPFTISPEAVGRRALKNACLYYLAQVEDAESIRLSVEQFRAADNMTDSIAALGVLTNMAAPERQEAIDAFYARWKDDALVLDKWFTLQAVSTLPDTLDRVKALMRHPAFEFKNPNKARALIGSFASGNPVRFHAKDGSGYRFVADQVLALDRLNPQTASRILGALTRWRKFDEERQELMRAELARIVATEGLSPDSYEVASKSLA